MLFLTSLSISRARYYSIIIISSVSLLGFLPLFFCLSFSLSVVNIASLPIIDICLSFKHRYRPDQRLPCSKKTNIVISDDGLCV